MEDYSLTINGIVSKRSRKKILTKLKYDHTEPFSEFLFFDYAKVDMPIGTAFSYFCKNSEPGSLSPFFCKIIMVTQQFALLYNQIPQGHKTLCHVVFDQLSYNMIREFIPVVDYWTILNNNFTIAISSENRQVMPES